MRTFTFYALIAGALSRVPVIANNPEINAVHGAFAVAMVCCLIAMFIAFPAPSRDDY